MRVTKDMVIKTACDLADSKGLNNVSLKAVAEALNIRTPSLYNHIENIEALLRETAHVGMREMNRRMTMCSIGKTGDDAIKSSAAEYFGYMIEHPGIYETIQWATWNGNEQTAEIFGEYTSLLKLLICSCGFDEEQAEDVLNILTGFIHGYTTMQLRFAFENPEKAKKSLKAAVETVLMGCYEKYEIKN